MKVFNDFNQYTRSKELFLTIGFFDGLHAGHQRILRPLVAEAKSEGYSSAVITFPFHPLKVLNPKKAPLAVITSRQKSQYLEELDVDYTFLIDFRSEIRDMEPVEFIEKILVEKLKLKKIYIGENFCFGKDGKGDVTLLKEEGRKFGFSVVSVPLMKIKGEIVSSTKIRGFITEGNLEKLREFLGRRYSVLGTVVEGKGISKQIKYPTANIKLGEILTPPEGVYTGWAKLDPYTKDSGTRVYRSAFDLRTKPEKIIEAHIIGLKRNIYYKEVEIIFLKKIRPRIIFKNRQEAHEQIARDVEDAKKLLSLKK